MTSLATGGWRDVIIVKSAAAAANPALTKLHFPVSTTGLNVHSDSAGNVSFTDDTGVVRLHAPTPFQWDSALPAAPAPAAGTRAQHVRPADAPVSGSTADAPGDGAHVAPMAITATASGIDLTPDQTKLGKGTGPWFLDPSVTADSGAIHSAQVQEYNPDSEYYDAVGELGTGYCGYDGSDPCTGTGRERAYFQIGINPAIYTQPGGAPRPPTVYRSTFLSQASDASSPGTSTPLGLYWTGPINQWTRWSAQPCGLDSTMQGCDKVGDSFGITGTGGISFDVTSQMQKAAAGKWSDWTVAIAPDDEYNKLYRHHISSNPHIVTDYDVAPSLWGTRTARAPGFASNNTSDGCNVPGHLARDAGWVGANQNILLTAASWSPTGFNLHTVFHFSDATTGTSSDVAADSGSWNPNGVSVPVGSLTDGHGYGWYATAYDDPNPANGLASPTSVGCYFRVDKTPPAVSVSSTDFPPSNTPNTSAKTATDSGTFYLTGTDPAPTGGSASGVACYRWSSNPTPVTGWRCTDSANNIDTGVVAGGNNKFTYTPGNAHWGTNILYVQAQDNAGNYSQPAAYSFYAPWNKSSSPLFGDVTGDAKPDILLPDAAGNLRLIGVTTDPNTATAASATSAPAAKDPAHKGTTWNDYQITHRGTMRNGRAVDDIFAHNTKDPQLKQNLYVALNSGTGTFDDKPMIYSKPTSCTDVGNNPMAMCPADYGSDWSNTTQILALGTPAGEGTGANPDPSSLVKTVTTTQTWLLAVEDGNLWLYDSKHMVARELSATGTWGQYDLLGPGPAAGTSQATLWTREKTTGTIRQYAITTTAGQIDYTNLADPAAKATVLATGLATAAAYPTIGSVGDLNGDNIPDLYGVDINGALKAWTGTASTPSGAATSVSTTASTLANLRSPVAHWLLNETTGTTAAADLLGLNPATLVGDAAFAPATVNGRTSAVVLKGAGEVDTAKAVVETGKSFSISLWANPHVLDNGVVISQDGANTSGFMLWPENKPDGTTSWRFAMATSDPSIGWPYNGADSISSAARAQADTWTRLTVSYDATTAQMALYVNGTLAGTGTHLPVTGFAKATVLGRYLTGGKSSNFFNGQISDVTINPYSIDPGSVTGQIASAIPSNVCLDNNYGSTTAGNPVQTWQCGKPPSAAQLWIAMPDSTLRASGSCLDIVNNGTTNGTLVDLFPCKQTDNQNQIWLVRADGSIYNPRSNRCLDIPNSIVTNGTRLEIWDCKPGAPNQKWYTAAVN